MSPDLLRQLSRMTREGARKANAPRAKSTLGISRSEPSPLSSCQFEERTSPEIYMVDRTLKPVHEQDGCLTVAVGCYLVALVIIAYFTL